MSTKDVTLCVYCGAAEADTVDHIPPQCLFAKPKPSNLITVPCCKPCNSSFEKDDEYFRTAMAFRWDVSNHPAAVPVLDAALRSVSREQAQGFRKLFTQTLEEAPIVTHAGIYVEEGARFNADIERIYGTVARIVRGLHYEKTGAPLPLSHRVIVLDEETMGQIDPAERNAMIRRLVPVNHGEPEVFGNEAFLFFWRFASNLKDTEWFLVFFSRVIFFGATVSPERLQAELVENASKPIA